MYSIQKWSVPPLSCHNLLFELSIQPYYICIVYKEVEEPFSRKHNKMWLMAQNGSLWHADEEIHALLREYSQITFLDLNVHAYFFSGSFSCVYFASKLTSSSFHII